MCEACTLHRTEDRCVTCRPRRTREERDERRRNAVRRSAWMHCEACGYLGPRFEQLGLPTGRELIPIAVVLLCMCFINVLAGAVTGALVGLSGLRGSRRLSCPRCRTADALWPATEQAGLPVDPDLLAASKANEATFRGQRRTGLFVVALAALLGALFFVARSGWLQTGR